MSYWFHRNPLKATEAAKFDYGKIVSGSTCSKIVAEARISRGRLLDLLTDPNNELETVEAEIKLYFSLLYGFLIPLDGEGEDSKLRRLQQFKWTNSMLGYRPTESSDTWFELLSMVLDIGLWYTKHAAKLAGKDEVSEDEAKEVHKCLRMAAGMFTYVKDEKGRAEPLDLPGSDFDPRVLSCYISQTTAEAQEVTVARAVTMSHSASLISALAYETSQLFHSAGESIKTSDGEIFSKWVAYLLLKEEFYLAMAYSYRGDVLLAEDKCGEGIRALKESLSHYEKAEEYCNVYSKAKGPGITIKPDRHLFFRRLRPILDRTLEKCERENGFIYHQKVPEEVPELEVKATYGLVKPEQFNLPEPHFDWSRDTYIGFDITKANMPDFKKPQQSKKDLPPVKEVEIYQSDKDPMNCAIS